MNWTRGIFELLDDNGPLSSHVDSRIYPIVAPQGTALPFITYEVTGTTITHTKEKATHQLARVEIVAYADTYGDAVTIGGAMRNAVKRASWQMGQLVIDQIFIDDETIEKLEDPERYAYVLEVQAFVPFK